MINKHFYYINISQVSLIWYIEEEEEEEEEEELQILLAPPKLRSCKVHVQIKSTYYARWDLQGIWKAENVQYIELLCE